MAIEEEAPDVGDRRQVRKRASKAEMQRHREVEDLRLILDTRGGRAFVWRLLGECEIYAFGHVADSNRLHFTNGRRSIGGWLLDELFQAAPNAYSVMRTEAEANQSKQDKEGIE